MLAGPAEMAQSAPGCPMRYQGRFWCYSASCRLWHITLSAKRKRGRDLAPRLRFALSVSLDRERYKVVCDAKPRDIATKR